MFRIILIGVLINSFLVLVGGALYFSGQFRFNQPSMEDFPVHGIHVSHHQGKIDWDKIDRTRVKFVYIKATEGGNWRDTRFDENWKESERVELIRGAYHFFTLCKNGLVQAANFTSMVPIEKGTLPPAVDLEFVGNCKRRPSLMGFTRELNEYLNAVQNHYEVEPVIYTTYKFFKKYLNYPQFDSLQIWIRDIFSQPDQVGGRHWTFWQYADNARLRGISGPVDLNVFSGSLVELKRLTL